MSTDPYDVIIIGTGAGGGTLLQALAHHGLRILVLERGDYLPREQANWSTTEVFQAGRYKAAETWYDRHGKAFHPGIHYHVGGNTKVYGAALVRFRAADFEELEHYGGGVSPAWPLKYDAFAPWYTAAEHLYQVHGQRGVDPTEPAESTPYPYPPISHEPRILKLQDDLRAAGHHPFPLPMGVRIHESDRERSACIRCSTCDGFPCLVDAKSDAHVLAVRPALQDKNVTLLTGAFVDRLETSPNGRRVDTVVVMRHGLREEYRGNIVVAAAGAINSAALLLRSSSSTHPRGLANSSGLVGRNYMCHNNSAMVAVSLTENPTVFQKTLGLNDFYFGCEEFPHPMGHIAMLGKSEATMFKGDAPPFTPHFVLDKLATHALDFWLTSEDLPDPENRVAIRPDGSIELIYTENNLEPHHRLIGKLKGLLSSIGCHENALWGGSLYLKKKMDISKTAHQCGTLVFGTDPQRSVLDTDCKAHDLDNLYVVDGGFFVSSTALNPALTIMANALRVGSHLRHRLYVPTLAGSES